MWEMIQFVDLIDSNYYKKIQIQLMFLQQAYTNPNTKQVAEWPCKLLNDKYELKHEIGHGTYGSVYRAENKLDQKQYALKKMENFFQNKHNEYGFPITTLREIKLLQKLNHINILNINEVVYEKQVARFRQSAKPPSIYLCLDLMEFDLQYLIRQQDYTFSLGKIQIILKQILEGLQYLHSSNIAHRDIKPANILINGEGVVKVADFGLAKKMTPLSTVKVCTMWYRAPELFLGYKQYTPNIDVWAVGCIAVQFLLREPLFCKEMNERDQILRIFKLCGTPDKNEFEQEAQKSQIFKQLEIDFSNDSEVIYFLKKNAPEHLTEDSFFDLVEKMLRLNPQSRATSEECLNHPFFRKQFPDSDLNAKEVAKKREMQNEEKDRLKKKVKN